MAVRDKQNTIRLMIVSLYALFMLPGIFSSRRFTHQFEVPELVVVTGLGVLVVYYILEFTEYYFFHYRYKSRRTVVTLFLVRAALVVGLLLLFDNGAIPLRHNPVQSAFFPLLIFYVYFAFPLRVSLPIAVTMIVVPGITGLFSVVPSAGGPLPDAMSFVIFRAVVGCFFFALAWLWDTERRRNDENRELLQELHHSERQLREYAAQVGHTVALEERTRLARDVHDSIGHALTAINIQLSKAQAYFSVDPDEARRALTAAHETATDAMGDIRESLGRLNGEESGIDLGMVVTRLAQELKSTGHTVRLALDGSGAGYNYAVLMGLYRCVQEGITNIMKHANATEVSITVKLGAEQGSVEITDNGRGFTMSPDGLPSSLGSVEPERRNPPQGTEHYGLRGLQRRFELVGGAVNLISAPGEGTTLIGSAPRDPLKLFGTG